MAELTPALPAAACALARWEGAGDALVIELQGPGGAPIGGLRALDGQGASPPARAADLDPRPGAVRVEQLLCGEVAAKPAPATLAPIPAQALQITGAAAGEPVFAWGPVGVAAGRAPALPVSGDGWTACAAAGPPPRCGPARAGQARLEPRDEAPRSFDPSGQDLGAALVVAHLIVSAAAIGALGRGLRALPAAAVAAAVAVGALALGLGRGEADLGGALLSAGGAVTDPRDSAALVAQLADAVRRGMDTGFTVRYPEGVSVLHLGPAWLGYLPVLPWGLFHQGFTGHNVGVGLWTALLGLAAAALARARGAGPAGATFAAATAALAPALWDELDAWSLDRATLAAAPVAALALDRAGGAPGAGLPRGARGLLLCGIAVGGALYAQVYTGLLLAAAAPAWALLRPPRAWPRLLGAGLLAALLAAPGLHTLRRPGLGDAGVLDPRPLGAAALDLPGPAEGQALLDAARAARQERAALPMGTAPARLGTAAALSMDGASLLSPDRWLIGGRLFWPLAALAAAIGGRGARRTLAEALVLLILALGPTLVWQGRWTGLPLPQLLPWALVPGWDQLKNVHRAALLAAPLAAVALGLGLDRAWGRRRGGAAVGAAAALGLALATHQGIPASPRWSPAPPRPALAGWSGRPVVALPWTHPLPDTVALAAAHRGLHLVNDPAFEAPAGLVPWDDTNPALNPLALRSGSPRTRTWLPPGAAGAGWAALRHHGVEGVVLIRGAVAPALEADLARWMDAQLPRAAEDPDTVVWAL